MYTYIPIGDKPLLPVLLYEKLCLVLKGKQECKAAGKPRKESKRPWSRAEAGGGLTAWSRAGLGAKTETVIGLLHADLPEIHLILTLDLPP